MSDIKTRWDANFHESLLELKEQLEDLTQPGSRIDDESFIDSLNICVKFVYNNRTQMGKHIHVTPPLIQDWMDGESLPPQTTRRKIFDSLIRDITELNIPATKLLQDFRIAVNKQQESNTIDAESFFSIFRTAARHLYRDPSKTADELLISRPTYDNWQERKRTPHANTRSRIVERISKDLDQKLSEISPK